MLCAGKHKMISKLATQSFHILRLIARNRNFSLPYFNVKNDQKVSNNMILMSKYKGKHGGKKGQKIRAWVDPPPPLHSGNAQKKTFFFN